MYFAAKNQFVLFKFETYEILALGKRTFLKRPYRGKPLVIDIEDVRKLPGLKKINLEVGREAK